MEVAQRYSIAWKGLKNGRHDFRFEVDKALFEAFESTEIKDGRCEVSVGVDRSEKQLTLDVGITGHVVVECDRCLEDCRVPIDFEGQLVVKFSDEVHEYDGEVMWMLPGEDRVELAQYIYESIVLSLPYQRVHPEGECDPDMLGRFRIVSDEEFASIEAGAGGEERRGGEWAKLAELRECMANGATEVDVALNVLAIKSGRLDVAQRELDELVRCAVGKVQLKAVFEHALYTPEEKRAVLQMLRSSGVNYVKIQNMLSGHGARVEDVRFASEILGRNVGIKIDGGIKTLAQAEELLAAGATRLGLTATAKIAEEALKNA